MSTALTTAPDSPTADAPRARRRRALRSYEGRRLPTWQLVLRYALLLLVLAVSIGPFLWELSTALKGPHEDIYSFPPKLLPSSPTLKNFSGVGGIIPVWDYVLNSVKVAATNVLTNLVGASMAGYALARLRFRGRRLATVLFIVAMLVPQETIVIAQFMEMRQLNLVNTLTAVVLPGSINAMNVLLMRNAFAKLPYEIEEAALVDGANVWQRFFRVALPAVKGTLAVVAIFAFMGSWDDFLWPLIVLSNPGNYTLTIGLNYLHGTFSDDQRLVAAGTIIAVAPLIVMFACLQRYFFKGVGEGAVKG